MAARPPGGPAPRGRGRRAPDRSPPGRRGGTPHARSGMLTPRPACPGGPGRSCRRTVKTLPCVMPIQQSRGAGDQLGADVVEGRDRAAEGPAQRRCPGDRPAPPAVPRTATRGGRRGDAAPGTPRRRAVSRRTPQAGPSSNFSPSHHDTLPRSSTRSSWACAQPPTAASTSVRISSARSAPTRDSSGMLRRLKRHRGQTAVGVADIEQAVAASPTRRPRAS